MILIATLYWLCVAAIVYHHVGYPLLLQYLAKRRPFISPAPASLNARLPSVSLIIPCHNEAAVIARKIENVAQLAYPPELLSVTLALDGCTDNTQYEAEIAIRRFGPESNWRVIEYGQNIGKVAVLNDQIAQSSGDIIALSDASSVVPSDALLRAASHFSDPTIGVVCPTYQLDADADPGEKAYWAYQRRVKSAESRVAAPMGAHGALYFFRRALWEPMPGDTINDDFILPMKIVLRGYRAVYDENIVTSELEKTAPGQDFRRRLRIGAGNMQQLLELAQLGDPRRGSTALVFLSGKGLRAVMPFVLVAAILLNGILAYVQGGIYSWLLVATLALLPVIALAAFVPAIAKLPPFSHISYIALGHAASGWGALLLLMGRHRALWKVSRVKSLNPIS